MTRELNLESRLGKTIKRVRTDHTKGLYSGAIFRYIRGKREEILKFEPNNGVWAVILNSRGDRIRGVRSGFSAPAVSSQYGVREPYGSAGQTVESVLRDSQISAKARFVLIHEPDYSYGMPRNPGIFRLYDLKH